MIKSSAQSGRRTRRGKPRTQASGTPNRIIAATLAVLREHGYAGTTARLIAAHGGFPVGLIFYHFGTLDDLLLAVLDHTSAARLRQWQELLADVDDLNSLLERMHLLYAEDVVSGHALAVKELVANGSFSERLGTAMAARMEPWFELAERTAARVLAGSLILRWIDPRELAVTVIALYLGLDTVSRLSGENTTAETLVGAALRLAPLVAPLAGRQSRRRSAQSTRVHVE